MSTNGTQQLRNLESSRIELLFSSVDCQADRGGARYKAQAGPDASLSDANANADIGRIGGLRLPLLPDMESRDEADDNGAIVTGNDCESRTEEHRIALCELWAYSLHFAV